MEGTFVNNSNFASCLLGLELYYISRPVFVIYYHGKKCSENLLISFFRLGDMKAARPAKRARLTVESYGTLALELPDIIHYIYTFSHSCLLS